MLTIYTDTEIFKIHVKSEKEAKEFLSGYRKGSFKPVIVKHAEFMGEVLY